MNSIRVRLLLIVTLAMTALAAVMGVVLHELVRADLYDSVDQSLETRARALTALTEQDEEGVHLEWLDPEDIERARPALPDHFALRQETKIVTSSGRFADFAWPETQDTAYGVTTLEDGTDVRYAVLHFTPKPEGGDFDPVSVDLLVAEPSAPVESTLADLRFWIAVVGLAGAMLGGALLFLIVSRETAPLTDLAAKISSLRADVANAEITLSRSPSELAPVLTQLNDLLQRLDAARAREREFTAGAAHELRTPLAGIRAKLELALSKERTPIEHRDFARDCLDISIGIQGVIERLLGLARLEAGEGTGAMKEVDLKPLVDTAWKPFAEKARQRELTVSFEVFNNKASVPEDALEVVLANLFENAVNYADSGGEVSIFAAVADSKLKLGVSNTATGVTDTDVQKSLEPFWRSDAARNAAGVHAGLGLSLCRRLVEAAGGRLVAHADTDRFVVTVEIKQPSL